MKAIPIRMRANLLSIPAAVALTALLPAIQLGQARATGELSPDYQRSYRGFANPAGQSLIPAGAVTADGIAAALARISPAELDPGTAAQPFVANTLVDDRTRALHCLTEAVYYEARSESLEGQQAVAQVVLNRVRHPAFPHSVCGVVYQGAERTTGCQFSFTCDGSLDRPIDRKSWIRSEAVAAAALGGFVFAPVGMATHYHANYVTPWWASKLARAVTIGTHIFYRWRGEWGDPLTFNKAYAGGELSPDELAGLGALDPNAAADPASAKTIEAGVSVYRGPAAQAAEESNAGVRVHRGDMAAPAAAAAAAPTSPAQSAETGVTIHHGEPQG